MITALLTLCCVSTVFCLLVLCSLYHKVDKTHQSFVLLLLNLADASNKAADAYKVGFKDLQSRIKGATTEEFNLEQ